MEFFEKYLIQTYGCQMNEHDSEAIIGIAEELGYTKQQNMIAPHNGTMYLLNDMLIEVCNKDVDGIYVSKV